MAIATKGNQAVISAYGPGAGDADQVATAAAALVEGVGTNQPMRLLVVGGTGSLEVAGRPAGRLARFPGCVQEDRSGAPGRPGNYPQGAIRLDLRQPSAEIAEGTRTGHYRLGKDKLLVDRNGKSRISMEDFAAAILDEVEKPQFSRQRFTVGY